MPLELATLLPVAGSLISGFLGSKSSKDAAEQAAAGAQQAAQAQANAAREALDLQRQMYQDQMRMSAPYYGAGTNALAQLASLYGLYQPGHFTPYSPGTLATQQAQAPVYAPVAGQSGQMQGVSNTLEQMYRDFELSQPSWLDQQRDTYDPVTANREMIASIQDILRGQQQPQYATVPQQQQAPSAPQFDPTGMAGFWGSPESQLSQRALAVAMDRGISGLDRAAAASGGLLSGGQAKRLSDYSQDTQNQYLQGAYTDYANRLAALAGIGQTAGQNQGNYAGNYAANAGNLMSAQGNAASEGLLNAANMRASGTMGSANSWNNALNGLAQFAGMGGFDNLFGGSGGGNLNLGAFNRSALGASGSIPTDFIF